MHKSRCGSISALKNIWLKQGLNAAELGLAQLGAASRPLEEKHGGSQGPIAESDGVMEGFGMVWTS